MRTFHIGLAATFLLLFCAPAIGEQNMEFSNVYFESSSAYGITIASGDDLVFTDVHVEFSDEMAQYLANCYWKGLSFQEAMDGYMSGKPYPD